MTDRFPYLLLVLNLLCLLLVQAQTPSANDELPPPTRSEKLPLRFERLGVEDGLAQGTIYSMVQDRRGFLWFGTQNGVSRYDGHTFKTYAPQKA